MKQITFLFLVVSLISCTNQSKNNEATIPEVKDTLQKEVVEKENATTTKKIVKVNFEKNKELLDIILLLPKESFSSWDWEIADRMKWYNEIKENNYYIDSDSQFFTQNYLEPNQAEFQIVDGSWSINIYKTNENSYIVITDDKVGDGNELHIYEFKSNQLKKYSDENTLFSNYKEQIKNKNNTTNCTEKFDELEGPIFVFDFSKENQIEIESSWFITKEEYADCFLANAIRYHFNPQTKKFDIEKAYWKAKKVE